MLEHLYKTLLISVISGSLLSMNPVSLMAATDGDSKLTTDNNGVITVTKKYNFNKVSTDDMLASITMLAGGIITGRMLKIYKPRTLDVMIAAAGGVAYIGGEVYSNVKFKGKISEMTVEVIKKSDGSVNDDQIKRLEDLKKSYEEAKSTVDIKKKLQLASAAAFGAAAIVATNLALTEDAQIGICRAALVKAKATLSTCISSGALVNPDAAACTECLAEVVAYMPRYFSYINTRAVPKMSIFSAKTTAPISSSVTAPVCPAATGIVPQEVAASLKLCNISAATMKGGETQAENPTGEAGANSNSDTLKKLLNLPTYTNLLNPELEKRRLSYSSYIEKGLNFLFPKAEAGWLPLLGLGAATLGTFLLTTTGLMTKMDMMMFVPRNRAIAWGVFGGIALMSAKSSGNVTSKLDENIEKIDTILAELRRLTKGIKTQNLTQQRVNITTIKAGDGGITFPTNDTGNTECMIGGNSANCSPVATQLASMPSFSNLPDSFKNIASQAVGLGDSLSGSGGISGSTLSNADSLGGKQNAIAKLLAKKQAALDKISKGKTTVQKEQDKFEKMLAARVTKALAQKGMTASGFMASIGSTPIDTSLANKEDAIKTPLKKEAIKANTIDLQAGAGKEAQDFQLDFTEQSSSEGPAIGDGSHSNEAGKEYEMNASEINGESGPTLFELISGRYIKSGYPKLLEEELIKK